MARALYIHWPFCLAKCPYCDFNSHVRDSVDVVAWQQALLADAPQPSPLGSAALPLPGALPAAAPPALAPGTPPRSLRAIEEEALVQALHAHRGRRTELARALGISERTLYRRLKALEASTTPLPPPA